MTETAAAEARDDRETLDDRGLDLLFREARTHNVWTGRPVADETLRRLHDLVRMGPTSANMCPARIVFVKSAAAKERLRPLLASGNVEKTMTAPVCAIIGHDLDFLDRMPFLFPHRDMSGMFRGDPATAEVAAFRNGSLQGGYFILAARALGLDCGPMSGFDNAAVDAEFFAGARVRSNFLCNLGYGDGSNLFPRHPRFAFEDVCQVL